MLRKKILEAVSKVLCLEDDYTIFENKMLVEEINYLRDENISYQKKLCLQKFQSSNIIKLEKENDDLKMKTSDYQKLSCLKTALEQEIARLGSEKWTTDRKVYSLERELSHLTASLKQKVTVDHTTSFTQLRKLWLENAIDSLNNENYGYGSYYELLVEKKHDAVDQFLWFNQQCLTKEEILHIKKATEYNDDFEPYTEVDAASGEILTIHDIIARDYA